MLNIKKGIQMTQKITPNINSWQAGNGSENLIFKSENKREIQRVPLQQR